jgi:hypothetical protein
MFDLVARVEHLKTHGIDVFPIKLGNEGVESGLVNFNTNRLDDFCNVSSCWRLVSSNFQKEVGSDVAHLLIWVRVPKGEYSVESKHFLVGSHKSLTAMLDQRGAICILEKSHV